MKCRRVGRWGRSLSQMSWSKRRGTTWTGSQWTDHWHRWVSHLRHGCSGPNQKTQRYFEWMMSQKKKGALVRPIRLLICIKLERVIKVWHKVSGIEEENQPRPCSVQRFGPDYLVMWGVYTSALKPLELLSSSDWARPLLVSNMFEI